MSQASHYPVRCSAHLYRYFSKEANAASQILVVKNSRNLGDTCYDAF